MRLLPDRILQHFFFPLSFFNIYEAAPACTLPMGKVQQCSRWGYTP